MSHQTRQVGLSFLLSVLIVGTASLSARLFREHRDAQIAEAQTTAIVACR